MTFTHLDEVLAEVQALGQLFADAGYRLFLVGGIVRDQWLDEPLDASSDIDLTTNASPTEIKKLVTPFAEDLWTQGEKFGTIGLRAGGRDYEITTHRAESYTSDSRKPVVRFGDDIDVDLSRRDFTVNAMAIELPNGELVDPYNGTADLGAGVLRTPLSADVSFSDDPLRMMRAARFATKYSLAPVDELIGSATELHQRLRIVAIERIGVELRRLLTLENRSVGLTFLRDTGLLSEVLAYGEPALIAEIAPKLDSAIAINSVPPIVVDVSDRWRFRLAATGLAIFETGNGVQAMCKRLRLSRDDERNIVARSRAALAVIEAPNLEAATLRRWVMTHCGRVDDAEFARRQATGEHPDRLRTDATLLANLIVGADRVANGAVADFAAALHRLRVTEDLDNVTFLDGDTIMDVLGITPGPAIGQAHAFLQDRYFELGPLDDGMQRELLRSWWADRATNS